MAHPLTPARWGGHRGRPRVPSAASSDWIEHEILLEEGADVDRMVQDMTIFDKGVVSIADVPRRKALA
jgi:hypothetical protein